MLTTITGKPQGRKSHGRAKTELTVSIENLNVGDSLVTGLALVDEVELTGLFAGTDEYEDAVAANEDAIAFNKRTLGNVRSKTTAASKENDKKFSVIVTEGDANVADGSVVVYRSA